ncbi:hypothetical protein CYMTET_32070 [Cymbomonas tetramitiformis]|uniref:Uncharacterized protein n=1 Tax=Cymbomonas tetramitiformis TaxID=36881 RepID=A0AAE0FGH8_9CHLO|nr:hypothetical protein CYMTET_32070 [Cymbomonas tetramitiformis]
MKEAKVRKAFRRVEPEFLAPLREPETLEALEALHLSGEGLSAPRARDEFAGVVRRVLRNLEGDSEDFWRLLGVAPWMLLAPPPGARKKSIPAELVRGKVARLVAGWGVGGSLQYRGSVDAGVAGPCFRGASYELYHQPHEGGAAREGDSAT